MREFTFYIGGLGWESEKAATHCIKLVRGMCGRPNHYWGCSGPGVMKMARRVLSALSLV